MKKHLEPHWFMEKGQACLTMRGVQIKRAIADALLKAREDGYQDGCSDTREAM
jgi:hypothetical protein